MFLNVAVDGEKLWLFSRLRNKCSFSCGTAAIEYPKPKFKAGQHMQNGLQVPSYTHENYY